MTDPDAPAHDPDVVPEAPAVVPDTGPTDDAAAVPDTPPTDVPETAGAVPSEPTPPVWAPSGLPQATGWPAATSPSVSPSPTPTLTPSEAPAPTAPVDPPVGQETPATEAPDVPAVAVPPPVPAWVPTPAPSSALPEATPTPAEQLAPVVLTKAPEPAAVPVLDVPASPDEALPDEALPDEPPPVRSGLLVPVLAALAVVLLGLTGFLGWQVNRTAGAPPVQTSRTQALTAAREAARLVFSYDYRHLDKDFAAGRAVTTGAFQAEYDRTTKKLVDDVAPRYKAVVSADVSEAGVVRATVDQVVCLVFVNQTSSSSLAAAPKITQSRLEMTLQRVKGSWLVAKIDAL